WPNLCVGCCAPKPTKSKSIRALTQFGIVKTTLPIKLCDSCYSDILERIKRLGFFLANDLFGGGSGFVAFTFNFLKETSGVCFYFTNLLFGVHFHRLNPGSSYVCSRCLTTSLKGDESSCPKCKWPRPILPKIEDKKDPDR